ncbi:MAG: response regulator [Nannocystaceae bacterium]|nr:response regulator [Nannocystaceae bacterium]
MKTLDSGSPRPILLVDDEPGLLDATRRRLEQALPGVELLAFSDPVEALRETEHRSLGLAILDIDMPSMSGVQLAEALHVRSPDLPVVFLTGTARETVADDLERVGVVAWLQKPVQGKVLIDAVNTHILCD